MQEIKHIIVNKSIPPNGFGIIRLLLSILIAFKHFLDLHNIKNHILLHFSLNTAIEIFFIYSGFFISSSLLKSTDLINYYTRRVKRIFPPVLCVTLISFFVLSFFSIYSLKEYYTNFEAYKFLIAHSFLLNFIQQGLPGVFTLNPLTNAVNGALWTLKNEAIFYLLVPFLFIFIKRLNNVKYTVLILLALYIISKISNHYIDQYIFNKPDLQYLGNQFPTFLQYFIVGIALFLLTNSKILYNPLLIVIGIMCMLERFFFSSNTLWPIGLGLTSIGIGFQMKNWDKVLHNNDYSYSIYVFHYPLSQVIVSLGIYFKYPVISIILYTIILTILSLCCWHLIEKKILRK